MSGSIDCELTLKSLFDKVAAALGLLLLFPLLLLIAMYVWAGTGRPILFRQERVGRNGKLFTIYKFRTMADGVDCRKVTPEGGILRKYKLDELPELWNVLKGDMSFVGPRPDVPGYADNLKGDARRILQLRPGITGPATMKYRDEEELIAKFVEEMRSEEKRRKYEIPTAATDEEVALWYNDKILYPDKTCINLYYLDHYSFWKDIQMIVCTVLGKTMNYAGELI